MVNDTLLQNFFEQHALKKRESKRNPVLAEKKNTVGKKQISSKEELKRKRKAELKRKSKAVKNIRIDSGKKQAFCTILKKTDQYEWFDINTLHHDRLKTLLRVVGYSFSNHKPVDTKHLVKDIEDNWGKLEEYYKKMENAAVV